MCAKASAMTIRLLLSAFFLVGCTATETVEVASVTPMVTPTRSMTTSVSPTQPPEAMPTVPVVTTLPTATTEAPTPRSIPSMTPVATPDDGFSRDLADKGYDELFGGSIVGPKGLVYTAHGFRDAALEPTFASLEPMTAEVCRLAFYRVEADGKQVLLETFAAPQFPLPSRYHGYPVMCQLVNWDHPVGGDLASIDPALHGQLSIEGYASDINENGFPEFALVSWFCPNACDGNEGQIDFFEIRSTSEIVRLTEGLPGAVYPWEVLSEGQSGTLSVQRVGLEYVPHLEIELAMVWVWNGEQYIDASRDHANDYIERANVLAETVSSLYGGPFVPNPRRELDMISVLFLYETAGRRQAGYELFDGLANIENWPETDEVGQCWLQSASAAARWALEHGQAYGLPPTSDAVDVWISMDNFPSYYADWANAGYDISACHAAK